MRGSIRVPFLALLGLLVVVAMLSARAAAEDLNDPTGPYDDFVLYTPQAAPADQALDLNSEELYPVAPELEVLPDATARRAPNSNAISSRRATAALTLLLAVRLNTPQFKARLGGVPNAGDSLGVLPAVAVASGRRIQGVVPVRRHLEVVRPRVSFDFALVVSPPSRGSTPMRIPRL